MKVLMVHNRYVQPGGEDVAFEQETQLLRDRNHEVFLFERDNQTIVANNALEKANLFSSSVWSRETYSAARRIIRELRPDVVHAHNVLALVSPSVFHAAWAEHVPVVHTIHNYRLICPAATLLRDGAPCDVCVGHVPWRGVVHGCYQQSRMASLGVASMLVAHRALHTWDRVDAYIAVSSYVRDRLVEGGLPAQQIHVKPNFVAQSVRVREGPGEYALYVGRLTSEKGLLTLLRAWTDSATQAPPVPLQIVGTGPLEATLRNVATRSNGQVRLRGHLPRDEVMRLLANARLLVCPSEWPEPLPFVVMEALAAGVPVLASRIGGLEEMVQPSTGAHFPPGDDAALADAATMLATDVERNVRAGRAARQAYLARYTPEQNYTRLIEIYDRARGRRLTCPRPSSRADEEAGTSTRVLFLTRDLLYSGGIPNAILYLAESCRDGRLDVRVASLESPPAEMSKAFSIIGISPYRLGKGRRPAPVMRLRRLLATQESDALVCNDFRSYIVGRLAGLGMNIPTFYWMHTALPIGGPFKRWLFERMSRRDGLIFVSEAVRRIHQPPRHRGPSAVVYSGVRDPLEASSDAPYARTVLPSLGVPADASVLCYTAEFVEWKDHVTLIRAFDLLDVSAINPYLLLIGTGVDMELVRHRARASPFAHRIRFLGARTDAKRILGAVDIYVHTSRVEGLGLAVVEAMLARRPVIVPREGTFLEYIEDGRTGLFFSPGDPSDLASKIQSLASDPARGRVIGERARQFCLKKFNQSTFARSMTRVIESA